MAIVRLQGEEELEYKEACARSAMLIEEGGERFKEEVKVEANQQNKSRACISLSAHYIDIGWGAQETWC